MKGLMLSRAIHAALLVTGLALLPIGSSAGDADGPRSGRAAPFTVSFDSEWIRISILGDSLEVRGTYFLLCGDQAGARVSLLYPFPRDTLLGAARMVSLHAGVDRADLAAIRWQAVPLMPGIRFETPACAADTIFLEAVYRQALTTSYARYIVTTTRGWHRPLRHARFDIRLPEGASPTEFSFPFEAVEDSTGRYYTYEVDSFYPDRDILVRWRAGQRE